MTIATSQRLHPEHGARYVFERAEGAASLTYRVAVHVAGGETLAATLSWAGEGAVVEPPLPAAIQAEVLRLARALRHRAPARMVRWRGE